MSKHTIQIEDDVYQSLKDYCDLNSMKIGPYVSKLIERGLKEDMYGDAPFLPKKRVESSGFLSSNALADILNNRNHVNDIVVQEETPVEHDEKTEEEVMTTDKIKEVVTEESVVNTERPIVKRRKLK